MLLIILSSMEGGELFSRIQERADTAFTERGSYLQLLQANPVICFSCLLISLAFYFLIIKKIPNINVDHFVTRMKHLGLPQLFTRCGGPRVGGNDGEGKY